ncbi:hypothetical protein JYB87_12800 [Shewanella avicenniae]|uniref:Uncharacterized protein n=1 Tax=Shewanella avicenniae TaxID=2814294 RepID=A0ABX7QMF0_9GAMM|nr:hypothetical protein [Shewanella avicenniae]QSX32627.1 hypothetical protein JYB87_12800 [Shewanella avicenniae]
MNGLFSPEMMVILRQRNLTAALLVYLDFASGPVYLHSGVGQLAYQGNTYLGIGTLGSIGAVTESGKVAPKKLRLTLSGIPPELLSSALTEYYQNRPAQIRFAILHNDTYAVIGADLLFAGRMDVMTLTDGDESTLQLDVNSRGIDWKNARNGRYTDADQQSRYPGDKFFEFVSQTVERELQWGIPSKSNTSSAGGGGTSNSTRMARR